MWRGLLGGCKGVWVERDLSYVVRRRLYEAMIGPDVNGGFLFDKTSR